MADEQSSDKISANISGPVQGQVAVGKDIAQTQAAGDMSIEISEAERADLHNAFDQLRARVAAEAPEDQKESALERVDELEQALAGETPDPTTAQYVKGWFAKNLPGLAGAVTGVLVHPVVGKIIQAAGEAIAGQFEGLTDR